MSTALGFFPYEAINYKAAQGYLDRRAQRGWELVHIYLGCIARFRQAETPSHFVDLDIRSEYLDTDVDPDYLQLCADAGWELAQSLRGMLLFRAQPGKSPVPIQTDGGMEWERFWKKYRPRVWHVLLYLALIALVVWARSLPSTENLAAAPASPSTLLGLCCLVLFGVYILLYFAHYACYLARCRRAGRVERPGPAATFIDSLNRLYVPLLCCFLLLNFVGRTGILGRTVDLEWSPWSTENTATVEACREWPVVTAADLGLSGEDYSRYLEGLRSPLMDYLEYRGIIDDSEGVSHILTTERYDCVSEGLAQWAVSRRRNETRDGKFLWGELEWEEAPGPGFDECYVCRDGTYLLFRQGRVAALVGCTGLDLTAPQALETIRERVLGGLP